MGSLDGKVAIVTGASRGIGTAIAEAFAQEGAQVAIGYNTNEERANALANSLDTASLVLSMDVSQRESVERAFAQVAEAWGHIDIIVNNAGFLKQTPFANIDDDEWSKTIDTNLKGVFLCSQIGESYFRNQAAVGRPGGAIINITSVGGQMGGTKAPHYAAAKSGVISLTKSGAKLVADIGVRVNAIAPGFIKTDMYDHIVANNDVDEILASIPLGRVGLPEDVAEAAVFLASDKSSYITGHVLNVNGGLYLGSGS